MKKEKNRNHKSCFAFGGKWSDFVSLNSPRLPLPAHLPIMRLTFKLIPQRYWKNCKLINYLSHSNEWVTAQLCEMPQVRQMWFILIIDFARPTSMMKMAWRHYIVARLRVKHCVLSLHIKFSGDFSFKTGFSGKPIDSAKNCSRAKIKFITQQLHLLHIFSLHIIKRPSKGIKHFLSASAHSYGRWVDWWAIRGSFSLMKASLLAFCDMWKRKTARKSSKSPKGAQLSVHCRNYFIHKLFRAVLLFTAHCPLRFQGWNAI